MVGGISSKLLGSVLILTAHMVLNAQAYKAVTGILGSNITLQFTFNDSSLFKEDGHFGVYFTEKETKISDNLDCKSCFNIYPQNFSVLYHLTNFSRNDSGVYWASYILVKGVIQSNNKVELIIQEATTSTTDSQKLTKSTEPPDKASSSLSPSHIIIILVLSPVVLLAAALPVLICYVGTSKNQEQGEAQRFSNPTLEETIEATSDLPGRSVVYSVLNFPHKPSAVVEMNPSNTDYAAVNIPEMRQM